MLVNSKIIEFNYCKIFYLTRRKKDDLIMKFWRDFGENSGGIIVKALKNLYKEFFLILFIKEGVLFYENRRTN
jgi:hypothetical protein